jgi:hypothetical protein
VALDEKPLAMFKDLARVGKEPRFVLRRLHDSVNELEHPALQEPASAFVASYDAVEFHRSFQTSTSARRPHLSFTTTTTTTPTEPLDDMEQVRSVTPSLGNRKDSRQSSVTEIEISSQPRSLTPPQQELLDPELQFKQSRKLTTARSATNRLLNVVAAIRSLKMATSPRRGRLPSSPSSCSSLDYTSARKEKTGMSQATQLDSLSVGYTIRLWRS